MSYFSVPLALRSSISSSKSMQLLLGFSSAFPPLNLSVEESNKRNTYYSLHLENTSDHLVLLKIIIIIIYCCSVWCGGKQPCSSGYSIKVKPLTLVDDHLLQLPLGRSPFQDLLVDSVGCDQAVHHHWFGLPDAVTAVLSLQVCLGVLRGEESITTHH